MVEKIEMADLPDQQPFTVFYPHIAAQATGQNTMIAPGHHPKCRLVKASYAMLAYATGASVMAIERGSGEDVATLTTPTALGVSAAATIAPAAGTTNVFEVNESICVNLTTQGSTTNAGILLATFETIH